MIKSINIDENMLKEIDTAIKALNLKSGANIYDFSSIIRIAINKYINSEEVQNIIVQLKINEQTINENTILSESSLSKDWLSDEEDKLWENL